jgi:hypothetical protein
MFNRKNISCFNVGKILSIFQSVSICKFAITFLTCSYLANLAAMLPPSYFVNLFKMVAVFSRISEKRKVPLVYCSTLPLLPFYCNGCMMITVINILVIINLAFHSYYLKALVFLSF